MKKIILDVDTGVDDAVGIMVAVGDKNLELMAVTTVAGNVSLETAYINSYRVLDMLGKNPRQLVFAGCQENVLERDVRAHEVHGIDGLNGMLRDKRYELCDVHGVLKIIELIRANPNRITFVGTAPITNLALAIKLAPDIVTKLQEVILMSGAYTVPGNVTPVAEFNAYGDPVALQIVLDAGFKKLKLIGLDVTKKTLMSANRIMTIEDEKTASFVMALTESYRKLYWDLDRLDGCAMHDPLAVTMVNHSDFCVFREAFVQVVINDGITHGQTVCDFKKQPNALVAVEVDSDKALEYMIRSLDRVKCHE
ncbi:MULTISPECIES: nucleoside hydrolase [unclassified Fusibacter]|uniref:nucleoside hydrolase n=1 Tax=unclassified Fusibacter TaxID=2624464 RepID=UPI001012BC76|nr:MULTISPECIES: nucleoside hydrolase [unclassified Fusibacter]MCK8058245.1 nucleoside hydrolase [Fusibacter sp. A2]NPE20828.1 nucleoside hydrolase [Fusibacter sp. A1]RXV63032.1 nucleoside hydrolase [Fusibacter sp. A1]